MKIRKNKVYFVNAKDLGLSTGHNVIVVKKHIFSNKVDVKTITSLEHESSKSKTGYLYDFKALNQAKKGKLIPIPINELNSQHYSAINNVNIITINKNALKKDKLQYKYPKKYRKVIK